MATIPAPPPGFIEEPQDAPAPPSGFVEPPAGFTEQSSSPIGIAAKPPTTLDYMRRLVFGGPEKQTVLGNAFPSLSDYNSASRPDPTSLPLIAPSEAIPSENQFEINPALQAGVQGAARAVSSIPGGQAVGALATPVGRDVARGIGDAAAGLTTPENLVIMAATRGMGALTPAKGYSSVAAKAVQGALGAYFTYQMAHGATDATRQAYDAYQHGDYDTAARLAGYAGINAFMAAMGIKHAAGNVRDILKTQVPKPSLKPTVLPPEEAEQPEPISAAPPPTIDVQAEGAPPPPPGFEEPAQEPQGFEKPEPVKPTQTPVVTAATPNPPTAAIPTVPEDPATIDIQMQQLTAGTRKVVMFPKGTQLLDNFPPGVRQTSDPFGNVYVYRPDLGVSPTIIKKAAKQNKLAEILGSTASGMGAPDKADLQGEPAAVTVHAPDGTEVQSAATDEANVPQTIAAAHEVVPPGGHVSIGPIEDVVKAREPEPAIPTPAAIPTPPPITGQFNKLQGVSKGFLDRVSKQDKGAWFDELSPQDQAEVIDKAQKLNNPQRQMPTPAPPISSAEPQAQPQLIPKPDTPAPPASLSQIASQETQTQASSPPVVGTPVERLHKAVDDLEPVKGVPVSTLRLRAALPDLSKEEFDKAALQLRNEQRVFASEHADPFNITDEERNVLIHDPTVIPPVGNDYMSARPHGTYYVALGVRQKPEQAAASANGGVAAPKVTVTHGEFIPQRPTAKPEKKLPGKRPFAPGDLVSWDENGIKLTGKVKSNHGSGLVKVETQQIGDRPAQVDVADEKDLSLAAGQHKHEFASTQVDLPPEVAAAFVKHGTKIPKSLLTEDGTETEPHVTVKYGLHDETGDTINKLRELLADEPPITLTIGRTSLFRNADADVLKADIDSADLRRINKEIADALPHTDTHPDYTPHATIAYVKPKEGLRYNNQSIVGVTGKTITIDHVTFSDRDGKKVSIKLAGKVAQPAKQPSEAGKAVAEAKAKKEAARQAREAKKKEDAAAVEALFTSSTTEQPSEAGKAVAEARAKKAAARAVKSNVTAGPSPAQAAEATQPVTSPEDVGGYYVSQIRDGKYRKLAGPFDTKAEAEAQVEPMRSKASDADPFSDFDSFGVMRDKEQAKPLAASTPDREAAFATEYQNLLTARKKEANLNFDEDAIKETVKRLSQVQDSGYSAATVGKRDARIDKVTTKEGRGKNVRERAKYSVKIFSPNSRPIEREFDNPPAAIHYAADSLYNIGTYDPERRWSGEYTERLMRSGSFLNNQDRAWAAAQAAGKVMGGDAQANANRIYAGAYLGGAYGAPINETYGHIAAEQAKHLPGNESALTTGTPTAVQAKLVAERAPTKEHYNSWENQLEDWQRSAKGMLDRLPAIRERFAFAREMKGGPTPEIESREKTFDEYERNIKKNLAYVEEQTKAELEKNRAELEPKVKAATAAFAKYGDLAYPEKGAQSASIDLARYLKLSGMNGGYRELMEKFGIPESTKPEILPEPTGKDKLLKAEREAIAGISLHGEEAYVPPSVLEKWRQRGWADSENKLTELGKQAVYSIRAGDLAAAQGKPMSEYRPGSGQVEDSGNTRIGAQGKIGEDTWHTNGHGMWRGDAPKNWAARAKDAPVPNMARVVPETKGEDVKPVGFAVTRKNPGDSNVSRTIWFNNGAAMNAEYFDYTNKKEGNVTWTSEPMGNGEPKPFQAYKDGKLVAVVMPMRGQLPDALASEKPSSSVTLGSGLGALQPFMDVAGKALTDYTKKVVVPKVKDIIHGSHEGILTLTHLLAPSAGVQPEIMDEIYRLKGGKEAAEYILASQLDKWAELVEGKIGLNLKRKGGMTQTEMIDFIDRQKTGTPQASADLQQLSNFLRKVDDEVFQRLKALDPDAHWLANHYRVLWKLIPGSPKASGLRGVFGKRPLAGSAGFLKKHTLDTMSEGIALGGVPFSYNPLTMFQASYADAMRYITAHEMWNNLPTIGARVWVKHGGRGPAGFSKFEDPIAQKWFKVKQGMVHAGDWWLEDGAARLLSNYISRDLIREHAFGRAMVAVKMASTAAELSFSGFHGVFESLVAMGSQMQRAVSRAQNVGFRQFDLGALAKAAKEFATAPLAPITAAKFGSEAKKMFANYDALSKTPEGQAWLQQYPEAMAGMRMFFDAGLKAKMPRDFYVSEFTNFLEHWNSANKNDPYHYIAAAVSAIPAFSQAVMMPLFDRFIPNLKIGFFIQDYELAKQEYADRLLSGEMSALEVAREVGENVENRFGELNFENLHHDRTFKTILQLAFRSATWLLGNVRIGAKAGPGQVRELVRAVKERRPPMLDRNVSTLIGIVLITAILGTIIHRLATGKWPETLKDVTHPVIDPATGIRVSLATYWRVYEGMLHNPKQTITSSLASFWMKLYEVLENKDYYGNRITESDDSIPRKTVENLAHLVALPFSYESWKASSKQSGNTASKVATALGFPKAPSWIEQTKAQALANSYLDQKGGDTRSRAEGDHQTAQNAIRVAIRRGEDPSPLIKKYESEGLISAHEVKSLVKSAKESQLLRSVKALNNLPQQLNVLKAATPAERQEISRYIQIQAGHARSQPWKWTPEAEATSKKFFGITPYKTPANIPTPEPIY